MRKSIVASLAALTVGAGLTSAQSWGPAVQDTPGASTPPIVIRPVVSEVAGPAGEAQPAIGRPCCAAPVIPCGDLGHCPAERLWFRADYLLWWIKHGQAPALVTTGSPADTIPGALGQPNTQILLGGAIDNEERSGGRFETGLWLNDEHTLGLAGGFFFLSKRTTNLDFGGSGAPSSPVIARPFLDAVTGQETVSLVAAPGFQAGTVTASLASRLWGAEANVESQLLGDGSSRLVLLAGYRYLEYIESLNIDETATILIPGGGVTGTGISSGDRFGTRNYFNGGQVGAEAEVCRGPLALSLTGKVALGSMHEIVNIRGGTTLTAFNGVTTTAPSGVLALPSNSGRFSQDRFAVLPEVGVNLGYQVTPRLRATVGYTFLYCDHVVRPGDQIDRALNTTQLPPPLGQGTLVGPARPAFSFHESDFWAQGVNCGLEFRF